MIDNFKQTICSYMPYVDMSVAYIKLHVQPV